LRRLPPSKGPSSEKEKKNRQKVILWWQRCNTLSINFIPHHEPSSKPHR
uniref:Ovule protein n=1 Tax=Taenia asiatica TaxID=60517 RepID=A0A0R3VSR4_TAEAS